MTLMVNGFPPKMSNEVLNNLFKSSLSAFWDNGKLTMGSTEGSRYFITLNDNSEIPVYLIKLENPMLFDAETKAYYSP